jgi:uncharacterized OB-fold protein
MYRPISPAFTEDVPYNVAIVELDEGPRLMTSIVGCDPEALEVGTPVEIVYDDINDEITLPRFRQIIT